MAGQLYIPIASHFVVDLFNVRNTRTGEPDDAAVAQVLIRDYRTGVAVPGVAWPVTMDHVSSGRYQATIDPTLELKRDHEYVIEMGVVGSEGEELQKERNAVARML